MDKITDFPLKNELGRDDELSCFQKALIDTSLERYGKQQWDNTTSYNKQGEPEAKEKTENHQNK